jgi:hypothetical protein
MTARQSTALLAAESAYRNGVVPDTLPDPLRETPTYVLTPDAFLLRLPSGLKFLYRKGEAVVVDRPDTVSEMDVTAFLNGSVYGAIVWLNGMVPLHASGVVHNGRVHAFTGHSGAGKSTLASALAAHDMPLMADDVLVLDLSDPSAVVCLPGHKQVKLWPDAVQLTEAGVIGRVRRDVEKLYVTPAAGYCREPLPLAELFFLDATSKTDVAFRPVSGALRFTLAQAAFFRPLFCNAIGGSGALFRVLSRISSQVAIGRFDRPKDKDLFADGVAAMAAHIRAA